MLANSWGYYTYLNRLGWWAIGGFVSRMQSSGAETLRLLLTCCWNSMNTLCTCLHNDHAGSHRKYSESCVNKDSHVHIPTPNSVAYSLANLDRPLKVLLLCTESLNHWNRSGTDLGFHPVIYHIYMVRCHTLNSHHT